MPRLGETINGKQVGHSKGTTLIWHACIDCSKERWVVLNHGNPRHLRCQICGCKQRPSLAGSQNHNWKGGKIGAGYGYIKIWLDPTDFFYPMTNGKGYVTEHRLVVAKHLGRCLHTWEIVHHKNHRKDDNRIKNLQLVSDDRHKQISILENRIRTLEARVTLLEAENTALRKEGNALYL